MPLHVDEERLRRRIVVRDGGRDAVRRDRCPILREDIAAVRLAYAVARVYAAMFVIKLDVSDSIRDLCAR